jgi:hypothetical protein
MQAQATIICHQCGNSTSIDFAVPDDARLRLTRMKDIYSGFEVQIACSSCPQKYTAYIAEDEANLTILVPGLEAERCRITHLHPYFLEAFEHELSACSLAFRQLIAATDDSTYLFHSYGPSTERAADAFLRMLFTQLISALETYLADTLIGEVLGDHRSTVKLLERDETLSQEKISLLEAYTKWEAVEHRVKRHLNGILYHNLPKVDALYSIVFGVRLPYSDQEHKARLNRAMVVRHDCVHRNGKTVEGARIEFTSNFYENAIKDVIALASSLESKLITFRASRPPVAGSLAFDDDRPF